MDTEQFTNPKWNQRTPNLRRRLLRVGLCDAALLVVLLLAGELAVRTFLPHYSRLLFTATLTGGYPKAVNSRNMRDREFPDQRPDDEIRLLCLGNSTTWGSGVPIDATYPKQLERLLNERDRGDGKHYFVINAGGEGRSLVEANQFLASEGLDYKPSVVVFGFSASILAMTARAESAALKSALSAAGAKQPSLASRLARGLRRQALWLHGRLSRTYFYVFFDANFRRQLYRLGVLRDRLDKPTGAIFAFGFDDPGVKLDEVEAAYAVLEKRLAEMKTLLDARGVPFIVLGIPSRFRITEQRSDNERGFDLRKIRIEPLDRIAAYCQKIDTPFVDLRTVLGDARREMARGALEWNPLYIPTDYSHLNEQGLHIAAEQLLRRIDALSLLRP